MLRPINNSKEKLPTDVKRIVESFQYPNGNGMDNYFVIGDKCTLNLIQLMPNGGNDTYTKDDHLLFKAYIEYSSMGKLHASFDIDWNSTGAYPNAFEYDKSFDISINSKLYYRWITFDKDNQFFKTIFKYVNTYANGMKCLEMTTLQDFIHNTGDMSSFRYEFITGYLLEDGSLTTPYGNYEKHPNIKIPQGYSPYCRKYGNVNLYCDIIIPEFHWLVEKKKLLNKNIYLFYNISNIKEVDILC